MKEYIGDGVYVSNENGMVKLETDRGYDNHHVYMEDAVLMSFFTWLARTRGLKIEVSRDANATQEQAPET